MRGTHSFGFDRNDARILSKAAPESCVERLNLRPLLLRPLAPALPGAPGAGGGTLGAFAPAVALSTLLPLLPLLPLPPRMWLLNLAAYWAMLAATSSDAHTASSYRNGAPHLSAHCAAMPAAAARRAGDDMLPLATNASGGTLGYLPEEGSVAAAGGSHTCSFTSPITPDTVPSLMTTTRAPLASAVHEKLSSP